MTKKAASGRRQTLANIFEGDFPYEPNPKDGFITTAPVCTFLPNGYGLYNNVGNVWEWYLYFLSVHTRACELIQAERSSGKNLHSTNTNIPTHQTINTIIVLLILLKGRGLVL